LLKTVSKIQNDGVCTAIKQAGKFKTRNEIAIKKGKKKMAEMSADRNFKNMLLVNSEKSSKLPAASTCIKTQKLYTSVLTSKLYPELATFF
jgi:hypothetical protein